MPKNKAAYIRYKEIDRCLRSSKNYDWDMLKKSVIEKLSRSHPTVNSISKRTLNYDLNFMKNEFNIKLDDVLYKKKPAILKYEDTSFSIRKEISEDDIERLKETLSYLSTFSRSESFKTIETVLSSLKGEIDFFEKNKKIVDFIENTYQKGFENLDKLVDYIINKEVVKIRYETYSKKITEEILHPHLLKQSKNLRWYLYGDILIDDDQREHKRPNPHTFALDRIKKIEPIPQKKYKESEIDYDSYFEDVFDHTKLRRRKADKIIFYVDTELVPLLDSNPPHPSYKIFKTASSSITRNVNGKEKTYVKRGMEVIICKGLKGEFLRNGHKIIVHEPKSLAEFIRNESMLNIKNYNAQI